MRPPIQIGDIEGAKVFDGDRLVVELAFFRGIVATPRHARTDLGFLPGRLRRPHDMQADSVSAGRPAARYWIDSTLAGKQTRAGRSAGLVSSSAQMK